jgi:hypothetical protein
MLKRLVLLLLLANLAFFAWTQGWLDSVVGVRPTGDREPERLARQVRPESITILSPAAVRAAAAAASAASAAAAAAQAAATGPACLEAGPFAAGAAVSAIAALQQVQPALPPGSWVDTRVDKPGVYIVYMGRFANRDALAKKEEELRRTRVVFEELREPADLQPGFSLGRYDQRAAAERALEQLAQRGIRTARVVELAAPAQLHMLRVEKADKALAAQLTGLRAEPLGRGFLPCGS